MSFSGDRLEKLQSALPENATLFFFVFSRFEYAMKACGCFDGNDGERISKSWRKLANRLGCSFFYQVKEDDIAPTLICAPPHKQVSRNGRPQFCAHVPKPSNAQMLFEAIGRVRDNLFHGGKGWGVEGDDPDRNRKLIDESLEVLHRALETDSNLRAAFWACSNADDPTA